MLVSTSSLVALGLAAVVFVVSINLSYWISLWTTGSLEGSRLEPTRYGIILVNPLAPTQSLASHLTRPDWPPGGLTPALADAATVIGADCRRILVDHRTPPVVEAELVLAD